MSSKGKRSTAKRRLFVEDDEPNDVQQKDPKIVDPIEDDDDDDDVAVAGVKKTSSSVLITETPQKKKKQKTAKSSSGGDGGGRQTTTTTSTSDEFRPFFSPKGRRFVTPEKEDGEEEVETPIKKDKAKKTLPMFQGLPLTSPLKPSKKIKTTSTRKDEEYVPTYIHKNIGYQRKGQATLSVKVKKTYAWIEKNYHIPTDFETNKFDYGPQSGTSYEERLVQAYNLSLLEPKNPQSSELEFCSSCTQIGHMKSDCPQLI